MKAISSRQNPKLKLVRRLQTEKRTRQREQLFVVEGERWLAELAHMPERISFLLVTESLAEKQTNLLDGFLAGDIYALPETLFADCSALDTPMGVIAVVTMDAQPVPENPAQWLILDAIADPGNLGTIMRSAAAAGVSAMLLAPDCVDPYNPKAVRASMGALLRMPFKQMSWEEVSEVVGKSAVYLADSHATQIYTDIDWNQPNALIVSNEANGATDPARAIATPITIPMSDSTESLNAAIAASVILFEAGRQRGWGLGIGD